MTCKQFSITLECFSATWSDWHFDWQPTKLLQRASVVHGPVAQTEVREGPGQMSAAEGCFSSGVHPGRDGYNQQNGQRGQAQTQKDERGPFGDQEGARDEVLQVTAWQFSNYRYSFRDKYLDFAGNRTHYLLVPGDTFVNRPSEEKKLGCLDPVLVSRAFCEDARRPFICAVYYAIPPPVYIRGSLGPVQLADVSIGRKDRKCSDWPKTGRNYITRQ